MTPLYAELNRWRVTPWAWGGHDGGLDCMLALASWVERLTGIDPGADLRLTYDDRASCQRETGFLRDPLGVTSRCFEGIAGLPVVERAAEGDIAVLSFGPHHHVGAVWTDVYGWASKDEHKSVTFYQPELVPIVLRVWGVGYAA